MNSHESLFKNMLSKGKPVFNSNNVLCYNIQTAVSNNNFSELLSLALLWCIFIFRYVQNKQIKRKTHFFVVNRTALSFHFWQQSEALNKYCKVS